MIYHILFFLTFCLRIHSIEWQDITNFFKPAVDTAQHAEQTVEQFGTQVGTQVAATAQTAASSVEQFATQVGSQATTTAHAIAESFEEGKDWVIQSGKETESAVVALFSDPVKELILKNMPSYWNNPYRDKIAVVRTGSQLNPAEEKAITSRLFQVKKNLSGQLNVQLTNAQVPKIAIIFSGGGYRAMFYTIGFLVGLQKTGLLDDITWMVGLSGSTWAIGNIMAHAAQAHQGAQTFSLSGFKNDLFSTIANKGLGEVTQAEAELMSDELLLRTVSGQPLTLVNIYGALLANRLLASFGNKRHQVYLSEQAPLIETGSWPIPLYTAVRGDNDLTPEQLMWYTFSPWEIGSHWLNAYSPTWGFGRVFKNGSSVDADPEKGLGFLFGTFGSAFSATVQDIYQNFASKISSPIVRTVVETIVIRPAGQKRLTWAEVDNFTRGMPASPISPVSGMRMVDAGLAFNVPYPAVSGKSVGRYPDIIIIVDASYYIAGAPELKKAEAYARRNDLQFPRIDYTNIDKKGMSVFKENDPSIPVVIYLPRTNDKTWWPSLSQSDMQTLSSYIEGFDIDKCVLASFCDTSNFNYSRAQMEQVAALGEFNARVASKPILQEIAQVVARKGAIVPAK